MIIQNKNFELYFPSCDSNISKYLGMSCLVIDENGEILLFVIGNLNLDSKVNKLIPKYGDLFKISNLPTIKWS